MPVCALCGTPCPPPFRAPQPEGPPDLDGRPGEPARSTLLRWVATCSGCGACAPDLSALQLAALPILRTAAYALLPSPFLRWAALVADTPVEAEALLQAAWAAEDLGIDASGLRRRAAAAWSGPADPDSALRLADLQRRAGLAAEAVATLDALPAGGGDAAARIAAFERARIAAGDTGRHVISSALRPPARTPHVTHGARGGTGFWARLARGSKR